MRPHETVFSGDSGFTLVEVLVSVMIFATLMTALYTSFNAFSLSSRRLKQEIKDSEAIDGGLRIMKEDLSRIIVGQPPRYQKPESESDRDPFRFELTEENVGGGVFSKLRIVSLNHIPVDGTEGTGPSQVVYYVRQGDNEENHLFRSDSMRPYADTDGSECDPLVFRHVAGFNITCVDKDAEMHERWDSDSRTSGYATPVAVKVSVTLHAGEFTTTARFTVELPAVREPLEPSS